MRILPVFLMTVSLLALTRDATAATEPAALTPAQIHAVMSSPLRHVRAIDAIMTRVIAEGLRRSRTFAGLVLALNRSDVIVYVETVSHLPASLSGRMLFAAGPRGQRYVRIQIQAHQPSRDVIATLGHELMHALEVSESPEVTDDVSLEKLYERIGSSGSRARQFDTTAAQNAGRRVRAELS